FSLNFDTSYNSNTGRAETINSSFSVNVTEKTTLSLGERYSDAERKYYTNFGIASEITKKMSVNANFWHDSKTGLRDASISTIYSEQCWALNLLLARSPGDSTRPAEYSFMFFVELKGLGQPPIKLYHFQTKPPTAN
ncbi:MAG TPA: hypothetical protein DHV16_01575, partial [Nitrospiraceae bacterium]|nr:hypothetical protein [Nitrospiraceae bacterium]